MKSQVQARVHTLILQKQILLNSILYELYDIILYVQFPMISVMMVKDAKAQNRSKIMPLLSTL